tara:strand:+ start:1700 stop:2131 length:432 start_codon:yes stop_codon:yes gene_type:complete
MMKMMVKGSLLLTLMYLMLLPVKADANNLVIEDVDKTVLSRQPYQIEVCYEEQVSGDKSGDMIKGALLGGLIGNNVTKNVDNGGAVGALIGGMIGHSQSNATGGTQRRCQWETRYNETRQTVYSHSLVTFTHDGKTHQLQFQK